MNIKRYEIVPDFPHGGFKVVDKLKDDYVCIPLICDSEKDLIDIMGKSMDELVASNLVHSGYLTEKT